MAYTANDLASIEQAIAMGVKKVKYGDKETEYHSIQDMIALRDQIKAELGGVSSIQNRRTMGIVVTTTNRRRYGYGY